MSIASYQALISDAIINRVQRDMALLLKIIAILWREQ